MNNGAFTGVNVNQFRNEALAQRNIATSTGTSIIPIGIWDEDWSIAGGEPAPPGTQSPNNYANAGAGNPIVAPNITLGQFLYCLENLFPAVEAQKNVHYFGQIIQGNLS